MQIKIDTTPYANLETDAIVSYVFDETDPIQGTLADIDKSANGLLKKLSTGAEFSGKPLEMTLIHAPAGLKAARLLLVGAGKRDKFDVAGLRKLAGAATRYLKARSIKKFAFLVRENDLSDNTAQAIVEGACEFCEAYDAILVLNDGDELMLGAHHGPLPMSRQRWVNVYGRLNPGMSLDRAMSTAAITVTSPIRTRTGMKR